MQPPRVLRGLGCPSHYPRVLLTGLVPGAAAGRVRGPWAAAGLGAGAGRLTRLRAGTAESQSLPLCTGFATRLGTGTWEKPPRRGLGWRRASAGPTRGPGAPGGAGTTGAGGGGTEPPGSCADLGPCPNTEPILGLKGPAFHSKSGDGFAANNSVFCERARTQKQQPKSVYIYFEPPELR